MLSRKLTHQIILGLVLLAGLLAFLAPNLLHREPALLQLPDDLAGVVIMSPPPELPDFQLNTHQNQTFGRNQLLDQWNLLFFGYTSCPDICPNTLSTLNLLSLKENFPQDSQIIFVTVDPQRDTVEKLAEYIAYFNPQFVGLTGPADALEQLSKPLGAPYYYVGDTNGDEYFVDHVGAIYLIDPQARVRAYILPPHDATRLAQAYLQIRNYYQ